MMSATPSSSPVEQIFARVAADLALVAGTIERLERLLKPTPPQPKEREHA